MRTIKLLIASLLGVLAIGAVVSGSVQADEWRIESETLLERKLKEENVSLVSKPIALLVPGFGLTITCEKAEGGGKIFEGGSSEFKATLKTCTTKVEKAEKTCSVSEPVVMEGKAQRIFAGKNTYEKLEPKGKALAIIKLTGAECFLPEKTEVTGSIAGEVPSTEQAELPLKFSTKISETANKELKSEEKPELKLAFGKQSASLSGEITSKLSGANAKKNFQIGVLARLCMFIEPNCPFSEYVLTTPLEVRNISPLKFEYGLVEVVCSEFVLEGATQARDFNPVGSFASATVESCSWEGEECTVIPLELPFKMDAERPPIVTGNGFFSLWGPNLSTDFKFKIVCGEKTCIYGRLGAQMTYTGGGPGVADVPRMALFREEGSEPSCEASAILEGGEAGTTAPLELKITSPIPLYFS
jgi:hypothetical protein